MSGVCLFERAECKAGGDLNRIFMNGQGFVVFLMVSSVESFHAFALLLWF